MKKLLSIVYGFGVDRRNRRYDEGRAEVLRAPGPVVSVGNIQVGGTGKTPFVQLLVRELKAMGKRPAILARGYGRSSRGLVVVSDGENVLVPPEQAGDELTMHAHSLGVPVLADADRVNGARYAFEHFDIDVVVLDDGFQHRRLHRDLDIVMCDARLLSDQSLLPAGRLREPLSGLQRADVLVARDTMTCYALDAWNPKAECLHARSELLAVRRADGLPMTTKKGCSVIMMTGIARPENLRRSIEKSGYNVMRELVFRDHHRYTRADMERAISACRNAGVFYLMVSEKDEVKLRTYLELLRESGVELCVLPMRLTIDEGRERLQQRLARIFD